MAWLGLGPGLGLGLGLGPGLGPGVVSGLDAEGGVTVVRHHRHELVLVLLAALRLPKARLARVSSRQAILGSASLGSASLGSASLGFEACGAYRCVVRLEVEAGEGKGDGVRGLAPHA